MLKNIYIFSKILFYLFVFKVISSNPNKVRHCSTIRKYYQIDDISNIQFFSLQLDKILWCLHIVKIILKRSTIRYNKVNKYIILTVFAALYFNSLIVYNLVTLNRTHIITKQDDYIQLI